MSRPARPGLVHACARGARRTHRRDRTLRCPRENVRLDSRAPSGCWALCSGAARRRQGAAEELRKPAAAAPADACAEAAITSATGRKHGGHAAAHARAADRLVVLNRPSGNVHGSARSAQKDRGCIVCNGMKSVRPRNGAIPFSARTVGRVEGAPRDMARQPCVQEAVQLSTRATRLLLCGTR